MNSAAVKINANATSDTNDYANGSNLTQPSVTAVGTINSNKGIRRWFSSLLLLGIVFSALAFSAEAKAAFWYGGAFYEECTYTSNGITYTGWARTYFFNGCYRSEFRGRNKTGSPICIIRTGYYEIPYMPEMVKPPVTEYQLSAMDISYNSYLEVKSPIDVTCDIYELSSGKQVMKDINIQGNSAWQSVQMQTNNHHYLIQFKVDGAVISQKTFLINNNQFYKGGL